MDIFYLKFYLKRKSKKVIEKEQIDHRRAVGLCKLEFNFYFEKFGQNFRA